MLRFCCRNTGALGPLLAMLQYSTDIDKVRFCLNTLAFLVLDRANRKTVAGLQGVDAILRVLHRLPNANIHIAALDALVSLVKHDDADKVSRGGLWIHCFCPCLHFCSQNKYRIKRSTVP